MVNTIRCDIDFTLMGTLDYPGLTLLYELSNSKLLKEGWRIDWYSDIPSLVTSEQNALNPHEFYEKLYNVIDLGLLHFSFLDDNKKASKISIYVHNSITYSYQIRYHIKSVFDSSSEFLDKIWEYIKNTNTLIRNMALNAQIVPLVDTWTIRFEKNSNGGYDDNLEVIQKPNENITSVLFGNDPVVVESASAIGESLRVLKILGHGCEQYLIFSFDKNEELAISRLYYLTLAKTQIKKLIDDLKRTSVPSIKKLQQETQQFQQIKRVKAVHVNRVLGLRSNVLKNWDDFRTVRGYIDLTFSFLSFHVESYFADIQETFIVKYTLGLVRSESNQLQLFYVEPLKSLAKRLEEDIQEALALTANLIEILNIDINLRLQVLMWRSQAISLVIAVVSLAVAVLAIFAVK